MSSLPIKQVRHLSIVPGLQHEVEVFGSHISTDETPAGTAKAIIIIATILFIKIVTKIFTSISSMSST